MPTAAEVIADMKLNGVASLNGVNQGTAYAKGGFIVMGADFRGEATPVWWNAANPFFGSWNAILPWFVAWDGANHSSNDINVTLWIRRISCYVKDSNSVWHTLEDDTTLGGEYFYRGLGPEGVVSGQSVSHYANGSLGVKWKAWDPGIFHGWGSHQGLPFPGSGVRGVHVRVEFQLIKTDPNGPDHFGFAEYGVEAGCDPYVYPGQKTGDFTPAFYNPGSGASRFKKATKDVQVVSYTTLNSAYSVETSSKGGKQSYFVMPDSTFLANLPPGVTLTGTPTAPPPSGLAVLGRITMAGDSLFKGNTQTQPFFYSPNLALKNAFNASAWTHTWVGTNLFGASPGDIPTSSQGGWTVDNLIADLPNVQALQLDGIIVSIGTNDMAGAGARIASYLTNLRVRIGTSARIYVCAPVQLGWFNATEAQTLRTNMQNWVAANPVSAYYIDLNLAGMGTSDFNGDGTHWSDAGATKIANYIYNGVSVSLGIRAPPPSSPPPTTPPPPTAPPPAARREIWFAGNALGSTEDGTASNPINTLNKLRTAIITYGPSGIDLRMRSGAVWTGVFAHEAFQYVGTTIRGDDWLSGLGYFEGGVRKTDWVAESGAPGGKQLWRCSSMTKESLVTGILQPGAVSVDDAIVANRRFRGNIGATIPFMDDFDASYSYDPVANVMFLMLPSGASPNTSITMVGQTSYCMYNSTFAAQNNTRTGITLQHMRFKRYSSAPIELANLPGVQLHNIYGKHIGGRYAFPTAMEGDVVRLIGGCDGFIVGDAKGDGVEGAVFRSLVTQTFPVQTGGVARKITGSHIGYGTVAATIGVENGGSLDGFLIEDPAGTMIGPYSPLGLRPDGTSGAAGIFGSSSTFGPGTTSMNDLVLRRAVAIDAPVATVDLAYATAGRQIFFEGCQGKVDAALTVDAGISFGHQASGTGTDKFIFRACAFGGYQRGIKHLGGQHSFSVEVTNCGFTDSDVAGIDMNGIANTTLTIKNNVAHNSQLLVRAINGVGSSAVNDGGNFVTTGTSLGVTAVGTDDTGQTNPGFVGSSVAKAPSGHAIYTGGVALSFSPPLADRLGQVFESPWAQGPYAEYTVVDGGVGSTPPVPGGSSGISIWEDYLTESGHIAYLAEQAIQTSLITGIGGIPTTLNLVVNETRLLAPVVTGIGEYSSAITYSVTIGSSATVLTTGLVKGVAVGQTRVRVASTQAPSVFVEVIVNVTNFNEAAITAVPASLALTMVGGVGSFVVMAAGKAQAVVSAISGDSLVAEADLLSGFDGSIRVTPKGVGNCTILVTKVSRAGGQQTIEVPVTVTSGTIASDVTEINAEDRLIFINEPFIEVEITDQNDVLIASRLRVVVSKPGYVNAPHTVIGGVLMVYPEGVGIAQVTIHDPVSKLTKVITIEVLPIGGMATPPPPPPPPVSPGDIDTLVEGDFIFEVLTE